MARTKIKWISHAGFQITSGTGKVIYIDPWFDNPLAAMKLDEVKQATLILVTHDHFDHLGQAAEIVRRRKVSSGQRRNCPTPARRCQNPTGESMLLWLWMNIGATWFMKAFLSP